jgi:hypothetical protein
MLIYVIGNPTQSVTDYVCDSQETIDAAPAYAKPTCTVGGETDANTVLVNNQQAWLTQKANLFTVDLQTTVEGGVVWTVVDLNTEPENTDRQYFVLDPTTGLYTEAVGLSAAKTLFAQMQQTYLVFTDMNAYTTMTSWT